MHIILIQNNKFRRYLFNYDRSVIWIFENKDVHIREFLHNTITSLFDTGKIKSMSLFCSYLIKFITFNNIFNNIFMILFLNFY